MSTRSVPSARRTARLDGSRTRSTAAPRRVRGRGRGSRRACANSRRRAPLGWWRRPGCSSVASSPRASRRHDPRCVRHRDDREPALVLYPGRCQRSAAAHVPQRRVLSDFVNQGVHARRVRKQRGRRRRRSCRRRGCVRAGRASRRRQGPRTPRSRRSRERRASARARATARGIRRRRPGR